MKVLITGASGMLGSYVVARFKDIAEITSLGRGTGNKVVCDLSREVPFFSDIRFDTVIHCAGTEDDNGATALNLDGTKRLAQALSLKPPENFVFISSHKVYSEDAGENINEDANLWVSSEAGRTKTMAEEFLRDWAERHDVTLTIIRPAIMFGNGVKGEMLRLFNDAVSGNYIHIRGNDARLSIVTALDVARGIRALYDHGGVYNAADGVNPRLIELAEAMSANAGAKKRMTHLPASWAEWIWRLGRFIPSIDRNLNPGVVEKRLKTFTLDGSKFSEKAGLSYFNTIDVIERTCTDYPYENT